MIRIKTDCEFGIVYIYLLLILLRIETAAPNIPVYTLLYPRTAPHVLHGTLPDKCYFTLLCNLLY